MIAARLRRLAAPVEAAQVRRFGRSLLAVVFRTPVLLLHTTGRRTGFERTTTLAVHVDGDGSLLVVGGAGGQAELPDWVANLRADPSCEVTYRRRRFAAEAEELAGDERSAMWERLTALWPRIVRYERKAGRPVPVVRLRSRPSAARRAGPSTPRR